MYLTEEPDDAVLAERAATGDERAFEALVLRYEGPLFRVALRMLGEHDEAKDATQAAFIKAYQKLESFDRQFRFFSWIYRILLNECLNRRRNRRPHEPIAANLAAAGGTPLEALESSERRRRVQDAVMTLAVEYREVIVLRHFVDLSYDDIAATLGIPEKTVKSRLYTARQRLMELLFEEKPQR